MTEIEAIYELNPLYKDKPRKALGEMYRLLVEIYGDEPEEILNIYNNIDTSKLDHGMVIGMLVLATGMFKAGGPLYIAARANLFDRALVTWPNDIEITKLGRE